VYVLSLCRRPYHFTEDPTILETEEINTLDEPMLMERLKRISQAFDNERNTKKAS